MGGCRALTGTSDLVLVDDGHGGAGATTSATTNASSSGVGGQMSATTSATATSSSTSSNGPSSSSSSATASSSSGNPIKTCDEYCNALAADCTGSQAQYDPAHPEDCQNYCPYLKSQDPSQFGDSLVCRSGYLPPSPTHCASAGPTGNTDCGDPCVNFCSLAIYLCNVYGQLQTCLNTCALWPDHNLKGYSAPAAKGDTLACRYYWLTRVASTSTTYCDALLDNSTLCN
jgi:hypothetical protein